MQKLSSVFLKAPDIAGRIKIHEKWIEDGYIVVPNALLIDKRISSQAIRIFLVLVVHAMRKDYAFPSHEILHEETGLARPQLIKYLKELETEKLIKIKRTGRANNYDLAYSQIDERIPAIKKHLHNVKLKIEQRKQEVLK